MSNMWVFSRKHIQWAVLAVVIIALAVYYLNYEQSKSAGATPGNERVYHMVTGEFKAVAENGKEVEVYRWDPGTIYVKKGEQVQLNISGVNGDSHPFVIEGLDIRGEVKKGKETIVRFTAEEEGIYRIICYNHHDLQNGGPMVGYIIVD
jgi:heme/copper-type cytochrome/quinol oxidase subunit 2